MKNTPAQKESIPRESAAELDDMLKHAAAYVATPQGIARVGSKFKDTPPEMVEHYLNLYEKSSRRGYDRGRRFALAGPA